MRALVKGLILFNTFAAGSFTQMWVYTGTLNSGLIVASAAIATGWLWLVWSGWYAR